MTEKLSSWRDAIPAAAAVYERPDGAAGCCWHIVLDDGNLRPSHVDLCASWAADNDHPECIAFGSLARRMSTTQLTKLYQSRAYAGGWISVSAEPISPEIPYLFTVELKP